MSDFEITVTILLPYLIIALIISGYILVAVIGTKGDSASKALIGFILENGERLQNGETLDYLGSPINTATRLVRYRYSYSYIIATSTNSSGFYILGSRQALNVRIMCIFSTLFVGWWGFPWGSIKTVQSIFVNTASGGDLSDTVGGFLRRFTDDTEPVFNNVSKYR